MKLKEEFKIKKKVNVRYVSSYRIEENNLIGISINYEDPEAKVNEGSKKGLVPMKKSLRFNTEQDRDHYYNEVFKEVPGTYEVDLVPVATKKGYTLDIQNFRYMSK